VEAFVIAVILALLIITFIAQSFLVQGQSMEPSLHDGQRLLVDKISYRFREPRRGEIIVFKYPSNPRRKFIKRVIGVGGDTVRIAEQVVCVNGDPLEDGAFTNGPTYGSFREAKVPPEHFFVLGDNRNNSDDSRFKDVGFVPREYVVGRALFIYWPLTQVGVIEIPEAFGRLR